MDLAHYNYWPLVEWYTVESGRGCRRVSRLGHDECRGYRDLKNKNRNIYQDGMDLYDQKQN